MAGEWEDDIYVSSLSLLSVQRGTLNATPNALQCVLQARVRGPHVHAELFPVYFHVFCLDWTIFRPSFDIWNVSFVNLSHKRPQQFDMWPLICVRDGQLLALLIKVNKGHRKSVPISFLVLREARRVQIRGGGVSGKVRSIKIMW